MIFNISFFLCTSAAIASEVISISIPDKIYALAEEPPADIMNSIFTKFLLVLSLLYITAIILMFASGIDRFRLYAVTLMIMSASAWFLRKFLMRNRAVQVAESTLCLIMLVDIARTIIKF